MDKNRFLSKRQRKINYDNNSQIDSVIIHKNLNLKTGKYNKKWSIIYILFLINNLDRWKILF